MPTPGPGPGVGDGGQVGEQVWHLSWLERTSMMERSQTRRDRG
jgi:hypothetical protein